MPAGFCSWLNKQGSWSMCVLWGHPEAGGGESFHVPRDQTCLVTVLEKCIWGQSHDFFQYLCKLTKAMHNAIDNANAVR